MQMANLHVMTAQHFVLLKNIEAYAAHKQVDPPIAFVLRNIQFAVVILYALDHFLVCLLLTSICRWFSRFK